MKMLSRCGHLCSRSLQGPRLPLVLERPRILGPTFVVNTGRVRAMGRWASLLGPPMDIGAWVPPSNLPSPPECNPVIQDILWVLTAEKGVGKEAHRWRWRLSSWSQWPRERPHLGSQHCTRHSYVPCHLLFWSLCYVSILHILLKVIHTTESNIYYWDYGDTKLL